MKRFVLKILMLVGIILSVAVNLSAQDVQLQAKVNRSAVGKNEQFTLQFSINANTQDFTPPDLSQFYVLSGPNESHSTQIINYDMTVSSSFSYILRPKAVGTFTIGSAKATSKGNVYSSEPITIKVTKESPRASDPNDPYSKAADNAFIKVLTSQTSVYQGEPFTADYKLYFNTNIGQPSISSQPDFTGFYHDDVDLKAQSNDIETYKGSRYHTAVVYEVVLIPQRSGTIRPGKVEMQIPTEVPTGRRDFFGRMFTQTVNQTSADDFPPIHVKPLPSQGKPDSFAGAVGDYHMDVSVSRNEVGANESVTLKIKISGSGNLKLIDAPKPDIPSAFEAYDPKYTENISVDGSGMHGSKTYEYLLIPRYGGTYKIPPLKFSYFDPAKERYQTITSDEMQIKVIGGAAQPSGQNGGVATTGEKEQVNFIGKDILFIKTDVGSLHKKGKNFFSSTGFYATLGGVGVIFAGMLGFFFFSTRPTDISRERSQKASKAAYKRLSQAKKEMDNNNSEGFYLALSSALWGYFSDKFTIPPSELTKDIVRDKLAEAQVESTAIEEVTDLLNRAEMARFTSVKASSNKVDYEEAARLITQIEKQL